jgi:hypothetical protein
MVSFKLPVLPLRKSKVWTVSGASSGTFNTFFTPRLALATIGRFSLWWFPELTTVGPKREAGGEVVAPVAWAGMMGAEEGGGGEEVARLKSIPRCIPNVTRRSGYIPQRRERYRLAVTDSGGRILKHASWA